MNGFKNKFQVLAALLLWTFPASAQEKMYLIPPVQLLPLKKMETNAYGLLVGEKTDVLNEKLWQNAAYPITAGKFAKVGKNLPPAAKSLHLKLLLTAAEPPQGTTGQNFITLRLRHLFENGYYNEVFRLMQKIPENKRSEEQNRLYADVLLLQDMQTACFLTEKEEEELYWQRLSAVCAAFEGKEDKAYLAAELLKEQNGEDAFLTNAIAYFLEKKPLTAEPEKTTPLTIAVRRKAGGSFTKTDNIGFQTLFVQDESVPVEQRLVIAERLVQKGILTPTKLRTYYQQIDATDAKQATGANQRAFLLQEAAALSSQPSDNIQKQLLLKKGMMSARKDNVAYAFANAAKDVLETLYADLDTLEDADTLLEAFTLAGLGEKTTEWYKKAELLFPVSKTTANGWYFAELLQTDKNGHFFIPALETMMAYAERNGTANEKFIAKIDRLMLMFQTLGMISTDESWHYTSFAEGSEEAFLAARQKNPALPDNKPVGDTVLEALEAFDGSYTGLLRGLALLNAAGLEREAAETALQSLNIVLNTDNGNE